ncbi:MAG: N-acetyltransferase [Thaumarchaeota archaeon]|nr:MAG: N-acetyltransferase [Nitrososphaerota archaeon]
MNEKGTIKLKNIGKDDYKFLYQLLSERGKIANISHKEMPSYEEHIKFISSKPYATWKIIYYNNKKSGSVYLTKQNEIGIFIKKEFQEKKIGSKVLELIIEQNGPGRYLANISPNNKKSIQFFKNQKFRLIQHTYEFIKS